MITLIFSVYDSAGSAFGMPIFCATKGVAIRSFSDSVNDPKSPFHIHARDYSLYNLGSLDDSNGKITALEQPELVVTAFDVLSRAEAGPGNPMPEGRVVPLK